MHSHSGARTERTLSLSKWKSKWFGDWSPGKTSQSKTANLNTLAILQHTDLLKCASLPTVSKSDHESEYNPVMSKYRFYHPIEVRYGDLDPQGHLNNAKYFTYTEQARIAYVKHLGLWDGGSFLDIGIILAEARMTFKAPVLWGQPIRVGVRVDRLGNKRFDVIYSIQDAHTQVEHAAGSTVQVAYDYHAAQTVPIPQEWRTILSDFENLK